MRKLNLDLNSLQVQSFDTSPGLPGRGTVRGYESENTACGQNTCYGVDTCAQNTCGWTLCVNECGENPPGDTVNGCWNPSIGTACSLQSPHMTMCDFSCEFACP